MVGKIVTLLLGVLVLLLVGTTAQAKPAPPPAPYTLGQEIVTNTDGVAWGLGNGPTVGFGSPLESKPTSTSWKFVWPGSPEPSQVTVYVVCVNS